MSWLGTDGSSLTHQGANGITQARAQKSTETQINLSQKKKVCLKTDILRGRDSERY